jgi:hypothetical protein
MVSTWGSDTICFVFFRGRARIPTVKVPPQGGTWPHVKTSSYQFAPVIIPPIQMSLYRLHDTKISSRRRAGGADCSRCSRRGRSSGEEEGPLRTTCLEFALEHCPTAPHQAWLGRVVVGWQKDLSTERLRAAYLERRSDECGSGPGPGRLRRHGRSFSLACGACGLRNTWQLAVKVSGPNGTCLGRCCRAISDRIEIGGTAPCRDVV